MDWICQIIIKLVGRNSYLDSPQVVGQPQGLPLQRSEGVSSASGLVQFVKWQQNNLSNLVSGVMEDILD